MSDGSAINAVTRICAVYGHPIKHSASPAMQNAGIAALNLNWRYVAFEVHPNDLRAAIEGAKAMKYLGLNLTVPHKLLALNMVDVVDARAKLWGAVNTIVFETRDKNGQWVPLAKVPADEITEIRSHGYNTDADAIIQDLKESFKWPDLKSASVLLLGAGGAARATAIRLVQEGVGLLFLSNRTEEKSIQIALEIRREQSGQQIKIVFQNQQKESELRNLLSGSGVNLQYGYPHDPVDLVINATSLGLKSSDALPIDLAWLQTRQPKRVYDMIYRPAETPLLAEAKKASALPGGGTACQTANGLGMLLYQGAKALELWSGQAAPIQVMRAALEKNIYV